MLVIIESAVKATCIEVAQHKVVPGENNQIHYHNYGMVCLNRFLFNTRVAATLYLCDMVHLNLCIILEKNALLSNRLITRYAYLECLAVADTHALI